MIPVTELARRVLTASTLDDKLAPWPEVEVRGQRAGPIPVLVRPDSLALPTTHRRLPSVFKADLQTPDGCGRVLHELLNHELQAIELMALALLRWPDAPAGFRRGLVASLADEQRHCAAYLERLRSTGGDHGDHPVSGFFWETLAPVTDCSAFVAGLSLCFEQANLDFSLEWRDRFARAGDSTTAALLQEVHDDEVRHVALGLRWFGRWAEGPRLDAWEAALTDPLSPARARGRHFDAEGRAQAGFTPEEIDQLRTVGGSRGRPPRVIWFDAGVEEVVEGGSRSAKSQAVTRALATLPMFLVGGEDVVVAPRPGTAFLTTLAEAGIAVPRFVDVADREHLGPHALRRLEPWGRTPEPLPDVEVLEPLTPWNPAWRDLSSKTHTLRAVQAFAGRPGIVEDLGRVWTSLEDPGQGPWVIKRPFSTSGTGRILGRGPLTPSQRTWVERSLLADGELLWQPWFERLVDMSLHHTIGDTVVLDGITRFETRAQGVYVAGHLGHWLQDLPSDLLRAIHTASLPTLLEDMGRHLAGRASALGYRGPLSLDAAIVVHDGAVCLHPCFEVNLRNTLGRIPLALTRKMDRRARGIWTLERWTPERAEVLGTANLQRGPSGWREGTLATTDPSTGGILSAVTVTAPP